MIRKEDRQEARVRRHMRIRKKVEGTAQRPRLAVFRSEKNIYAQIIDDVAQVTIVAASSLEKDFSGAGSNKAAAREVGKLVAQRAAEKGIKSVVFDRGGFIYHGRIQELAEGAREAGLEF